MLMGSSASAQENDKAAVRAAEDLAAKWRQAGDKKEAAGMAALFTEDGLLMPANGAPPVSGRSEIEKALAGLFKAGFDHEVVNVSQGRLTGKDAGWALGDYTWTGRRATGEAIELKGRFMEVIVRDGGDWKIRVLAGNVTLPPPPQPTNK